MIRLAAVVALGLAVAGCDLVSSMADVFKNAQAVASDLESTTGLKPSVGANWKNGHLSQVTVTYPRLPEGKAMPDLVEAIRAVIRKEFKQDPENIVLTFVIPKP